MSDGSWGAGIGCVDYGIEWLWVPGGEMCALCGDGTG